MDAFGTARERALAQTVQGGIGTLGEKTLHAALKFYCQPDFDWHEVLIGRYVADILDNEHIVEIQTRQLWRLKQKLEAFLPNYPVTVVYPIAAKKWVSWIDPGTGETTSRRLSPKRGRVYDVFFELYALKCFLNHPHFSVTLPLLEVEESRLLCGWSADRKRGSRRFDRVPAALLDEMTLVESEDYQRLIPPGLPEAFDSVSFAKAAKIPRTHAQRGLNLLHTAGVIEKAGKNGNLQLYTQK